MNSSRHHGVLLGTRVYIQYSVTLLSEHLTGFFQVTSKIKVILRLINFKIVNNDHIWTLGLTYQSNVIIVQSNHHTRKVFVVTFNFLLDLIISFLQPRDISLRNSRRIPVYSFSSFVLKCLLHIGHNSKDSCIHSKEDGLHFTVIKVNI